MENEKSQTPGGREAHFSIFHSPFSIYLARSRVNILERR